MIDHRTRAFANQRGQLLRCVRTVAHNILVHHQQRSTCSVRGFLRLQIWLELGQAEHRFDGFLHAAIQIGIILRAGQWVYRRFVPNIVQGPFYWMGGWFQMGTLRSGDAVFHKNSSLRRKPFMVCSKVCIAPWFWKLSFVPVASTGANGARRPDFRLRVELRKLFHHIRCCTSRL